MSKTSFKVFCVEFYANHTGRTGQEVYDEFKRTDLLICVLHGEGNRQASFCKVLRGGRCVSTIW